jgi:hypothetical protein
MRFGFVFPALMKANDKLRKDLKQSAKEGQDNYRVKQIKNLRQQLREAQAIADGLTLELLNKTGMQKEDVNQLYDRILSQPKLAKPNNPVKLKKEVLLVQQQLAAAERELAATKKLLREYRSGERRIEDDQLVRPQPSPSKASAALSESALAEELRQLRLQHEITLGEIDTKNKVISLHRDMCAKLQQENRELRHVKMQSEVLEAQKQKAEAEATRTRLEMMRTAENTEEYHQDLRELRTKLNSVLNMRDKVEAAHNAKVAALQQNVAKIQEREAHLLSQINLLKTDLKAAQEAALAYQAQAVSAAQAQKPPSSTVKSGAAGHEQQVWDLQTKLQIVTKDLKSTKAELKALQAERQGRTDDALASYRLRIHDLERENTSLSARFDEVERSFVVRESHSANVADLQAKYHALLKEIHGKQTKREHDAALIQDLQAAKVAADAAHANVAGQLAQIQEERQRERETISQQEAEIKQLHAALQERSAAFQASIAAPSAAAAGSSATSGSQGSLGGAREALSRDTSRSTLSDGYGDLFGDADQDPKQLRKKIKKQEETHLEHVAKLMRNFEIKEKELLYQIAKLQETIKPGSGSRVHLQWQNPYKQQLAPRPNVNNRPPVNISSSDESESDNDV